jgi:hypothetical protein
MNVVVFAIHLDQLRLEIVADLGEDGTKASDGISVQCPISVFCDEDQMDVKLKHAVSAVSYFT